MSKLFPVNDLISKFFIPRRVWFTSTSKVTLLPVGIILML